MVLRRMDLRGERLKDAFYGFLKEDEQTKDEKNDGEEGEEGKKKKRKKIDACRPKIAMRKVRNGKEESK